MLQQARYIRISQDKPYFQNTILHDAILNWLGQGDCHIVDIVAHIGLPFSPVYEALLDLYRAQEILRIFYREGSHGWYEYSLQNGAFWKPYGRYLAVLQHFTPGRKTTINYLASRLGMVRQSTRKTVQELWRAHWLEREIRNARGTRCDLYYRAYARQKLTVSELVKAGYDGTDL
jgi:hypothetical protein